MESMKEYLILIYSDWIIVFLVVISTVKGQVIRKATQKGYLKLVVNVRLNCTEKSVKLVK